MAQEFNQKDADIILKKHPPEHPHCPDCTWGKKDNGSSFHPPLELMHTKNGWIYKCPACNKTRPLTPIELYQL